MRARQGFGAIEVIIVIVVIAIIGGIAWYALKGKPMKQESSPSPVAESVTNSPSVSPSTPYLEIKQFGLKMKLTPSILDLEYLYDESQQKVSFGSKGLNELAKTGNVTTCYAEEGALGWITKQSQEFPANRNKPAEKDVKQFGGSYYGYFTPDVGCPGGVATNGEALQKLSEEQLTEVRAAIQTLELIK